ncbi:MAG: histidine kinase, partial [Cytophagales bacterium]|nr:histidine kinase [Cytophagales bacterium]
PWTWQISLVLIQLVALTVIWEGIRWIHNYLNGILPFEQKLVLRLVVQISINFLFSGVLSLFIITLMNNFAPWQLNNPMRGLFVITSLMFLLLINFSYIATYFFEEWKKSLVVAERLEKEKANVQYDNLKNQLNPHFLFNSITSLHSLIYENQDLAAQFLQQLSKVYRYVLQNRENDHVPLETELKFIDNYLSLLKTRFGEVFGFRVTISDSALDKRIVPVTLQVLIENAIKHNRMTMDKPLIIKIYDNDGYVVVENPLQIKEQVESSNKLGLINLNNLYRFLSEKPILVEESESWYRIKIPLL